ncbi:hypothetical protein Tcan_09474 [Toxocara canis]|uniref:Uncharacterized protein n=1 Tax=Toxocara canis TaxID=6265 RepID=A0A0B2VKD4_TOXCA|nr:hypothetical protein Tcan_09474 [Toxocara canis]
MKYAWTTNGSTLAPGRSALFVTAEQNSVRSTAAMDRRCPIVLSTCRCKSPTRSAAITKSIIFRAQTRPGRCFRIVGGGVGWYQSSVVDTTTMGPPPAASEFSELHSELQKMGRPGRCFRIVGGGVGWYQSSVVVDTTTMGPPPAASEFSELHSELQKMGYPKTVSVDQLSQMMGAGLDSDQFAEMVVWLCTELSELYGLEETVRPLSEAENPEFFMLELSSLLNELG